MAIKITEMVVFMQKIGGNMKHIIFLSALVLLLAGCAQQPQYGNPPQAQEPQPPKTPQTEPFSFNSAEIRYDIINNGEKTTVIMKDDGSILVLSKHNGSTVAEMKSAEIQEEEFDNLVIALEEKKFFTLAETFGNFDEPGYTKVLELTVDGKTKNLACQNSCPPTIEEIINKIEQAILQTE
ncbi:MAG: hypothetical protein AAB558_04020 [Patescibacteria group bacterium]